MTKIKLKEWIIPTLGIIVIVGVLLLYYILGNVLTYEFEPENDYVTDPLVETTKEVQNEIIINPIKPYNSEEVSISKFYYNYDDEEAMQQQSLIRYENIYMPNTGILYSSDNEFDVLAVLDGKISSIKEDDILGNIIEIEHSNNIVTIYQSVKDVKYKIGDTVKQGDIIAKSGSNKLKDEKENCLHFETYKDGNIMNPEDFYNLTITS